MNRGFVLFNLYVSLYPAKGYNDHVFVLTQMPRVLRHNTVTMSNMSTNQTNTSASPITSNPPTPPCNGSSTHREVNNNERSVQNGLHHNATQPSAEMSVQRTTNREVRELYDALYEGRHSGSN